MSEKYMIGDKIKCLVGGENVEGVLVLVGSFDNPGAIKVTKSEFYAFSVGNVENLRCYHYNCFGRGFDKEKVQLIKKGWAHRQYDYWNKKSLLERIKWVLFGHF